MKTKTLLAFASCAALVAAALSTGCETESADAVGVSVHPGYSKLHAAGQTVTLTANGWDNFTWKCEPAGKGVLSSSTGKSVVFTAVESGSATITATPIAGGATSNGVSSVSSGSAIVFNDWGTGGSGTSSGGSATPTP